MKTNTVAEAPPPTTGRRPGETQTGGTPVPPAPSKPGELRTIKLAHIQASKTNPRKDFNDAKLAELADSIRANGLLAPLLVRPCLPPGYKNGQQLQVGKGLGITEDRFELVDGERRLRACQSIRLDEVTCLVKPLSDGEARKVQLLSFVRENLSDLEAARGYEDLMKHHGYTAEQLRQELGLGRSTFYGRMTILKAGKDILDALAKGDITQSHVQLLVSVPDEKARKELLEECSDDWNPLSVRDLKEKIEEDYVTSVDKAPFDVTASYASAVIKLPCEGCEFRGANAKDKYPGLNLRPNSCLKPECFKSKVQAKQLLTMEALQAKGVEVLPPAESAKVFPYSYSDRPQGKGGFTSLSEFGYSNKGVKPFSALLGKDAKKLKSVKAFHPDGKLHDIYREKDVWELLEKKGIKPKKEGSSKPETPEQKAKRDREAKITNQANERTALAVVQAAGKDVRDALRVVVMLKDAYNYSFTHTLDRLELPRGKDKLGGALNKLKAEALGMLLLEMAMRSYGGSFHEHSVRDAAQMLGVDMKGIRKQVAAELEAAGKAESGKRKAEKDQPAKPAKVKKSHKK